MFKMRSSWHTYDSNSARGFTLVELIIVVTVIAILATIGTVSYRGMQLRAKASVISEGLIQIDDAFNVWATRAGFTRWIPESNSSGGLSIEERINDGTPPWDKLEEYLPRPPKLQDIGTEPWQYDNDEDEATYATCTANGGTGWCTGDDKTPCSTDEPQKLTGVNILIRYLRPDQKELAYEINKIIDKSEPVADWERCGKIRWYESTTQPASLRGMIVYSISYTKQVK